MTFDKDPNMTGDETTLLSTGGDWLLSSDFQKRATESEQSRIESAIPSLLTFFDFLRAVRRSDSSLAFAIDFEFLYQGSDELQDSHEKNLEELEEFYDHYEPGPSDYSAEAIEAFVRNRFSGLKAALSEFSEASLCFVRNGSFIEARIYLDESAANRRGLLKTIRDGLSRLYRPDAGETLFLAHATNIPVLGTITGIEYNDTLDREEVHFVRPEGRYDSYILEDVTFYPDAPTDSRYIYRAVFEESEFMGASEYHDLGFFFDPDDAFNHIESIKAGETKLPVKSNSEFTELFVVVDKL